MKKLKSLILTICFMLAVSSTNIYATNRRIEYATTTSGTSSPPTASGKTELDGKIGEWDPDDSEKPNFDDYDDPSNIEGTIPGSDKYFTISVTVPTNMQFAVFHNTQNYRGSFYCPEYNIKNNGSKTISVKVKDVEDNAVSSISSNRAPLYIGGNMIPGNNKAEMELFLTAIDGFNKKNIRLYDDMSVFNDEEKTLYTLQANETKQMKLYSDLWDLPQYEVGKDEAEANFTLSLEFSVATPSTVTP